MSPDWFAAIVASAPEGEAVVSVTVHAPLSGNAPFPRVRVVTRAGNELRTYDPKPWVLEGATDYLTPVRVEQIFHEETMSRLKWGDEAR